MPSSTSSSESSVQNFEDTSAPWRVLLSRTTLATVVFLVLAEALLHVPGIRSTVPFSNVYYTNHVGPRLQALESTIRSEDGVDLLFVGSSIVRTNFRPLLFDSIAGIASGREIVSFNGGLSGLPPDGVRLYLEHFFLPRVEPELVFQGLRLPELARSEPADSVEALSHGLVEGLWMDGSALSRVRALARENVRLLQLRGLLARSVRARMFPPPRPETYPIDGRGWNARRRDVVERVASGELNPLESHRDVWDLAAARRGLEIIAEVAELVRTRGIEYVLVNVPEHPARYRSDDARRAYREYLEMVTRFSEERGIPFIDVTGGDPESYGRDDWFSDGHHMTAEGARQFTAAVARAWLRRMENGGRSVVSESSS